MFDNWRTQNQQYLQIADFDLAGKFGVNQEAHIEVTIPFAGFAGSTINVPFSTSGDALPSQLRYAWLAAIAFFRGFVLVSLSLTMVQTIMRTMRQY